MIIYVVVTDVSWSVFYTRKTFKKGKVAQRARDNLNDYLGGGYRCILERGTEGQGQLK